MAREVLKDLIAENRIDNIRIIQTNDPVIGGQPNDNENEFNSNISARDLACTLLYALTEIIKVDEKDIPAILDALGDSRTAGASQRIVNEVNKLAKNAETAANLANDKANQAKQEAYNAEQKAVGAQKKADQVPNPMLNNFVVGNTTTAYKLMTDIEVKALLGVPEAAKLYSGTGQSTDGAMTQKSATNQLFLGEFKNLTGSRIQGVTYYNNTDKIKEIWIGYAIKDQSVAYLAVGNGNFQGSQIIQSGMFLHSHMYMRIDPGVAYNFYLQKNNPNATLEIQQWLER